MSYNTEITKLRCVISFYFRIMIFFFLMLKSMSYLHKCLIKSSNMLKFCLGILCRRICTSLIRFNLNSCSKIFIWINLKIYFKAKIVFKNLYENNSLTCCRYKCIMVLECHKWFWQVS